MLCNRGYKLVNSFDVSFWTVNKWWHVDTFMVWPIKLQTHCTYVSVQNENTQQVAHHVYIRWIRVRSYAFKLNYFLWRHVTINSIHFQSAWSYQIRYIRKSNYGKAFKPIKRIATHWEWNVECYFRLTSITTCVIHLERLLFDTGN